MIPVKSIIPRVFRKPDFRMSLAIWLITIVIISTSFFFLMYYSLLSSSLNEVNLTEYINVLKSNSIKAGIFTLILITFMLIPFILYLSRKLTTPLKDISKMAAELAEGNFGIRIEAKSNNEIDALARSFNTMADKLQNTYQELNDKIFDLNSQKEEINLKNLKLEQVIEVNKTILKQLEEKNTELEKANKVKAGFLSTMSHELRTPLNSIIGYTEMILDGNDGDINDEQNKDLSVILKSSENLLGMINDVLDLSKIEAGKMPYTFKRFNLVTEIQNIIEGIKGMAHSKNLDLIFDFEPLLPDMYSDPSKISHIVSNVLSNAIKFTNKGYVQVKIKLENEYFISISIIDTGIGIPERELHSIFDEFKQIDGSSTRKYGGTGLGLAIARAFTNGLGGKISVTSKIDEGSTFTIILPLNNSGKLIEDNKLIENKKEIPDNSNEVIDFEFSPDENNKVVVITRNSNDFSIIENILSKYNYNVTIIDYPHSIDTIKAIIPACIFIDIDLPCSNCNNGWLTLLDLGQDKITRNIPKIVITTQVDSNLGYSLGASDYLVKPFNEHGILQCISKCYNKKTRGYILIIDEDKETINTVSRVIRKNTTYSTLMVTSLKDIKNVLESANLPRLIIYNASSTSVKSFDIIELLNSLNLKEKIPILSIATKELSSLEEKFLVQHSNQIISKSDIRYSVLLSQIKKVMLEFQECDIITEE